MRVAWLKSSMPDDDAPPMSDPGAQRSNPPRVLVIEDAESTRNLIRMILGRIGCEVRGCADGTSGLSEARAWLPDVIILDLALPDMVGWDVMVGLRADASTARIPVIVATAHAAPDVRTRADREGVMRLLGKPFDPAVLRSTVEALLRESVGS